MLINAFITFCYWANTEYQMKFRFTSPRYTIQLKSTSCVTSICSTHSILISGGSIHGFLEGTLYWAGEGLSFTSICALGISCDRNIMWEPRVEIFAFRHIGWSFVWKFTDDRGRWVLGNLLWLFWFKKWNYILRLYNSTPWKWLRQSTVMYMIHLLIE